MVTGKNKYFHNVNHMVSITSHLWPPHHGLPHNDSDLVFKCPDGQVAAPVSLFRAMSPVINSALAGICSAHCTEILLPDKSIEMVFRSLELIYNGKVLMPSKQHLEEVCYFITQELGIDMIADWTSILNPGVGPPNATTNTDHRNLIEADFIKHMANVKKALGLTSTSFNTVHESDNSPVIQKSSATIKEKKKLGGPLRAQNKKQVREAERKDLHFEADDVLTAKGSNHAPSFDSGMNCEDYGFDAQTGPTSLIGTHEQVENVNISRTKPASTYQTKPTKVKAPKKSDKSTKSSMIQKCDSSNKGKKRLGGPLCSQNKKEVLKATKKNFATVEFDDENLSDIQPIMSFFKAPNNLRGIISEENASDGQRASSSWSTLGSTSGSNFASTSLSSVTSSPGKTLKNPKKPKFILSKLLPTFHSTPVNGNVLKKRSRKRKAVETPTINNLTGSVNNSVIQKPSKKSVRNHPTYKDMITEALGKMGESDRNSIAEFIVKEFKLEEDLSAIKKKMRISLRGMVKSRKLREIDQGKKIHSTFIIAD